MRSVMEERVVIPTLVCQYRHLEDMFVGAIRPELVRAAKRGGVSAVALLNGAIRGIPGQLSAHLQRNPQVCYKYMARLLGERMERFSDCPSVTKMVESETGYRRLEVLERIHVEHCPLCQRDLRLIRSGLPYYEEFNVR